MKTNTCRATVALVLFVSAIFLVKKHIKKNKNDSEKIEPQRHDEWETEASRKR